MAWRYCTQTFPKVYTEKSFLFLIGYKKRDFLDLTRDKSILYKKHSQLKSDGIRTREIYKPVWPLKRLLKSINRKFLAKFSFPGFINCGPKGRSIVSAARGHKEFAYHLSLDVESFYDRIQEPVLRDTLLKVGITKQIVDIIILATVEDNKLPQGFPTSSLLSALVISSALEDFYTLFDKKLILLSIFADDLLISSNNEKLIWDAKKFVQVQLELVGLKLNSKEIFSKKGEKISWLNLQIHPWVSLPRKDWMLLQKKVHNYKETGVIPQDFRPKKKGNLKRSWERSVKGRIAFAQSVSKNNLLTKTLRDLRLAKKRERNTKFPK